MEEPATYAIGDIHGCWQTLCRLLEMLPFRPEMDRLWLVGDLVNRGPRSLEVLNWAIEQDHQLGKRFRCVLGNHDLYLLRRGARLSKPRSGDRLDEILRSPDRDRLLDWVARRPLLYRSRGRVLVHAGLLPSWSVKKAKRLAIKAGKRLAGPDRYDFLAEPSRLRRAVGILTGIRSVDRSGLPVAYSGPPERAPKRLRPWYEGRSNEPDSRLFVFGHWAALGLRCKKRWICLDSGCAWGGSLSAVRLEDRTIFQAPAEPEDRRPQDRR